MTWEYGVDMRKKGKIGEYSEKIRNIYKEVPDELLEDCMIVPGTNFSFRMLIFCLRAFVEDASEIIGKQDDYSSLVSSCNWACHGERSTRFKNKDGTPKHTTVTEKRMKEIVDDFERLVGDITDFVSSSGDSTER
eukprot:TRINITY_DN3546_c0_g1_i10.p2 TRINITY_DN3546_c0_g1~~TRINITY_DN3546_c0_g1_i10.p2  ORF type:complete len:149 (+),score=38.03 TRINITY_DN3546_c0_g1_i10:43-447(+)